jgi:hypothetical protein
MNLTGMKNLSKWVWELFELDITFKKKRDKGLVRFKNKENCHVKYLSYNLQIPLVLRL